METIKLSLLLILFWLPHSPTWAIEIPTTVQGNDSKTAVAQRASSIDKQTGKVSKAKKESKAKQKAFVPREKISADIAVSFPADI